MNKRGCCQVLIDNTVIQTVKNSQVYPLGIFFKNCPACELVPRVWQERGGGTAEERVKNSIGVFLS